MTSIFDSMIPSRRREQKRLREEAQRLDERWGSLRISAPNNGCWIGSDPTPELDWSSPSTSTQGFASPDMTRAPVYNSPELGDWGQQIVIFDMEADLAAQAYHQEPEKNTITFTIPLPWSSRKSHSRSPSATQPTLPSFDTLRIASPRPTTGSAVVYKPASNQYLSELGALSRGNSPVPPIVSSARGASQPPATEQPLRQSNQLASFTRHSPSPPVDREEGHNISTIMLLSPVEEDFPSRPAASSSFSPTSSQRIIAQFTRQTPSPNPERPSTARSSTSTSTSRASAATDSSFHSTNTHHATRSSSQGPSLAHTGTMRSASREPAPRRTLSREPSERRPISRDQAERRAISRESHERRPVSREPTERRAMSREPLSRRAISRDPTERRAMSREPFNRRAISREPSRRRAPSKESVVHRPLLEELRSYARSRSERASTESGSSDKISASEARPNSTTAAGYYTSMVDEYRHIAWDYSNPPVPDSDSLVGRVGKLVKEKPKPLKEWAPPVPKKDLVPRGTDLFG